MSERNTVIPLYFNSKDRVNVSDPTTDYTIKLRKDLRNISSIAVSNVGIPRTYTDINKNNNTLIVVVSTEEGVKTQFNIVLTSKNYTPEEFKDELQTAFNVNQTSISLGLVWTIDYNEYFSIFVHYAPGIFISWSISFVYTPLVDVIGIGNGGTTENSYLYTTTNTDTLSIPVNRKTGLGNVLQFNITSKALTENINTSYITSLAKSFTVDDTNNTIEFDTLQNLNKHVSQLPLGTDSIGDVSFRHSIDMSEDGSTIVDGYPNNHGYTGSVYTYQKQGVGSYTQTSQTQTKQALSANGQEGFDTAISKNGLIMITGSPGDDWVLLEGKMLGAAHIYAWTGSSWVQRFKITPSSSNPLDQQLGTQVAISGDGTVVAASSFVETLVYKNTDNIWKLIGRFSFSDNPCLNEDGTILSLYNGGVIEIWDLDDGVWELSQAIVHTKPVVSMSDTGDILVTSGGGSVNVYMNNGGYSLDSTLTQLSTHFGVSACVSGDGTRIAIGDPVNNAGAVWIYIKISNVWVLEQKIEFTTVTSETNPNINGTIKLSTNGRTLITNGFSADESTGSVWIWEYNTIDNKWEESSLIKPVGFSSDTDQGFSSSIAHGGDVFVTGGPLDNSFQGAVWVYRRDRFMWNQEGGKIVASDLSPNSNAEFGYSVSMSGDGNIFAVGAIRDFGGGSSAAVSTGAVWTYIYNNGEWVQQGNKIVGTPFNSYQYQGASVALNQDGNVLAVGAPGFHYPTGGDGVVFIYYWDIVGWSQYSTPLQHTQLTSSSANGWDVSLNAVGDILVVGAPADNAVSVFKKNGAVWEEHSFLQGVGYASTSSYGQKVCISSDGLTIAVGAPGMSPGDRGYVDIWIMLNDVWTRQHTITEQPFASSVDLSYDGDVLCVGSLDGLNQVDITSRTYPYVRKNGVWTQFDKPIVGEKRTGTEDYQGFSNSVEYLDDTKGWILIIGGIGYGQFQGGNWSYISDGTFNTTELYTVPERSYTIFDLVNVLNTNFIKTNVKFVFTFNDSNTVTVKVKSSDGVSAIFSSGDGTTFDIFTFKKKEELQEHDSDEIDFSINNNIIKPVNVSHIYSNNIYDTDPVLEFRKYSPGYTINSTDVIDIQLRDERDRIVDLGGVDWIMTAYVTINN